MGLWTVAHAKTILPALVVMILLAAGLRAVIGKKTIKVRMIPFQVIACILVLLEIGKQAVSFSRGYDLYHIPLHFCSLFIFAMPAMAFYNGKHCATVRAVTAALCAAMSALMLIFPNIIYSEENISNYFRGFLDFHTVTFHNLVLFAFVLIVALELHTPEETGEQKAVILFTAGFCVVSAVMSQLLKTNYAGFYSCNVPVFEALRLSLRDTLGALVAQVLYVCVIASLHILFVWGSYWLFRFLRKLTAIKQPVLQSP